MLLRFQPSTPQNGDRSPRENGPVEKIPKKEIPTSPRSDSSHGSAPSSNKHKDVGVVAALVTPARVRKMVALQQHDVGRTYSILVKIAVLKKIIKYYALLCRSRTLPSSENSQRCYASRAHSLVAPCLAK